MRYLALPAVVGLLSGFTPWSAGYYYFRRWQRNSLWQMLTDAVNQAGRGAVGRAAPPSLLYLDSQSVRLAPHALHTGGWTGKVYQGQ